MHPATKPIESSHRVSIGINILTGGLAGCVAKTAIAPLDRAKINFQSTRMPFNVRNLTQFLKNTYQEQGFMCLWRGNTATLARIFPYAAIQYSAHDHYKYLLGISSTSEISHIRLRRFLAGVGAGTTSVICTYPLDVARARMAVTTASRYSSLFHAIRSLYMEEGLHSLYRGFQPALLGIIPYAGTAFFTFETLKEICLDRNQELTGKRPRKLRPLENLCCGAVAGILGQTASYPLDIVRRRMQTANITGHPEYIESVYKTLLFVYKDEGLIHGLYKGLSVNWIKGPVASGISFTVYHQLQHILHQWIITDE
uniref:Grave disease carrier protein homolog n=2 Tax=Schistosoma japonicum TaxID=6182 RepID=C1LIV9_SCHJA|nr:Grave disease carrier protein homolog [Schistosoma japonicum]